MSRSLLTLLAAIGLATAPLRPAVAADAPVGAVRVQVVVRDTHKELNVHHATRGSVGGGLFIPFFAWGTVVKGEVRDGKLTAAVGEYPRGDTLAAAFAKVMPAKYPVFSVQAVREGRTHANDGDLVRVAQGAGMHYLLLVDEDFSGVSSTQAMSDTDQVSVAESVRFELFDVASGKRLHKSRATAFSLTRTGLEAALSSGEFYRAHHPVVAEAIAGFVVGDLLRTDKLHAMADAHGHGDAVPALAAVLAKYDDPVWIRPKAPKGWRVVKLATPYASVVEPNSEARFKFGLNLSVDLLVPEFEQDVASVEDYLAGPMSTRLDEAGLDLSTLAPLATDLLTAPPGYTGYVVRRKEGTGGQVILIRMLEKPYVALLIVVASEDLDGHLARHRGDIEAAFAQAGIEIDHDRPALRKRPYGG